MDSLSPMRSDMGDQDPFSNAPAADTEDGVDQDPFGGAMGDDGADADEGKQDTAEDVFGGVEEANDGMGGADDGMMGGGDDGDVFGLDSKDAGEMNTMAPPADGPYVKWQEEHKDLLQTRLQEAREQKEKLLEEAEGNIKKFYEERSKTKDDMHSENVAEEKQKRDDLAKLFKEGENDWEKVCKMLTLAPDSNRKVDRFRKLLLTLKNEGTHSKSARPEQKS